MAVTGFDGADRVIGFDAAQLAIPLQIDPLTLADGPMLATHAVMLGQQLLTLEPRALGVDVAQRQRAVLAFYNSSAG